MPAALREILQGTIDIENAVIDYPTFFYQPQGWESSLPLLHASSTISEPAPVVLYLRHLIKPGDVVIIEEPEAHLHPAAQAELTRLLVGAVRQNIHVIMTTHSEWILEKIANLIALSRLSPEDRNSLADTDSVFLSPEQVGVWRFDAPGNRQGTVVENIPFDADGGGFNRTGYAYVADTLYDEWTAMADRVSEPAESCNTGKQA